jgi:hypothetical protein
MTCHSPRPEMTIKAPTAQNQVINTPRTIAPAIFRSLPIQIRGHRRRANNKANVSHAEQNRRQRE